MAVVKEEHLIHNGIDLESLDKTVKAIQNKPELGKCKFRISNKWISGGHNHSVVKDFYGCGREMSHKHIFDLDADEPEALGGTDYGANPVEHLLNALAACVTTSMAAHAAVRGIEIQEIESQVEGDIDLQGFLGLDNKTPKGFQNIRMKFKIKADLKDIEKIKKLALFSPVYNTITQGANIDIELLYNNNLQLER